MPRELQSLGSLARSLRQLSGGYFRNTLREPMATCAVCTTPVQGYPRCYPCQQHVWQASSGQLADAVAPLVYGVKGQQSSYAMHGYKASPAPPAHWRAVTLLAVVGLGRHASCAGRLARAPLTHWATVPSLAGRLGEHPLRRIVQAAPPPGSEVQVQVADASDPRTLRPGRFTITEPLPPRSHVLIIDDTWATGARVQSLALGLRASGAAHVSALVLARWLVPGFGDNAAFIRDRLRQDYDPDICPWTGSACP